MEKFDMFGLVFWKGVLEGKYVLNNTGWPLNYN
jgi:hypothetical protein